MPRETMTAKRERTLEVARRMNEHYPAAECALHYWGDPFRLTIAVLLSAQTILRDAIGRATAAEVTARRDQLDRELKRLLEEKVSAWGITVLSVEVRNILLPEELQEVMSLEAQAEQKKKARLILMEAESEISAMIEGYAHTYDDNTALELRKMYLLYEGVKEGKGTVVVPSSWNEGFADKVAEDAGK